MRLISIKERKNSEEEDKEGDDQEMKIADSEYSLRDMSRRNLLDESSY